MQSKYKVVLKMDLRFYLLKVELCGIKNIDKPITLKYYNETLRNFNPQKSNIKAIYGTNGAGKSATINAIDIYKELIINDNNLTDRHNISKLIGLINKKTRELRIKMTMLLYDIETNKKKCICCHEIHVKVDDKLDVFINFEKISKINGDNLNSNKETDICVIENGNLISSYYVEQMESIKLSTMNLLSKRSIVNILKYDSLKDESPMFFYISMIYVFANSLFIELNETDKHNMIFGNELEKYDFSSLFMKKDEKNKMGNNVTFSSIFEIPQIHHDTDFILESRINDYVKKIKNLTYFLKIFKPELHDIEIETKELKNMYSCEKIFIYDDYKINSEFESTGIKKLINLYNAFCSLEKGRVVFIDELDANIHDVYLCKLLEYFNEYSNGQLCFTTHNLAPMEVLSKKKHSIDFLSDNSVLTSWKRNGNYSCINAYRSGMIKNSPFNVEPFDFIGVFGDKDE